MALMESGTSLSLVSRNRVPMATASAPQASAAARPRPSVNPPAAMTGRSMASSTSPISSEVGTTPVCPPPSAPCAMTASTPHSATFSAWRRAPMVGMTTTPADRRRSTVRRSGACAKDATRTSAVMRCSTRRSMSPASERRFTPNGSVVAARTSSMAVTIWSKVMGAAAMMPRPPARAVAAVRRDPATQPMPVWTIGCRTPTRSQNRVWRRRSGAVGVGSVIAGLSRRTRPCGGPGGR